MWTGLNFSRGFVRASHILNISPWLLIATICHSITHRYTFSMWLVRHGTNYSLNHPPLGSQLSPLSSIVSKKKDFSDCNSCFRRAGIRTIPQAVRVQMTRCLHLWSQRSQLSQWNPGKCGYEWVSLNARQKMEQGDWWCTKCKLCADRWRSVM